MKFEKKSLRNVVLLMSVLVPGIWLLLGSGSPGPEAAFRRARLQQAFAPAGSISQSVAEETGATGALVVYDSVTPRVVDFREVDVNAPYTDGQYDRWRRGEIDLDASEGIISDAERQALQAAALQAPPGEGIQIARQGPGLAAPTLGTHFDSIDYTECCGGSGSVPPDPEMAVGPDHIIATVNVGVAIYDKSGTALLGPTAAVNLFSQSPCTSGLFDPNVIYDEEAERWFLAYDQGAFNAGGGYCVLVSQTDDPMGTWYEYFFNLNNGSSWMDYPHAGVGDTHIFMGGNIFSSPGGNFVEGRIYAFDKTDLYAGDPVTVVAQGLGATYDTPQPLNLHGASSGSWPALGDIHYFLAEPYDGANYTLFRWNTSTLTNRGNINLGTGLAPVDVPQNGAGFLQANDWRPQDFEYRNGYGWTTMTIGCNPGSGTVDCVRWAQIDISTAPPTLGPAGSGVLSSNGQYRFFSDLAVNRCNDMVIGYTKSSSSMWPSVWYSGRESGDPANSLQAETELKAGEIAYTAFDSSPRRWGDYTGLTIDPDGLTFWYLGQYSKDTGTTNGRWGTYIASFTYSGCTVATPTPTSTPTSTPTNTPVGTPTSTPTNTPTGTSTSTPDGTPTSTPDGTPTSTPTNTPTNTPTATSTATSTPTTEEPSYPVYLPIISRP